MGVRKEVPVQGGRVGHLDAAADEATSGGGGGGDGGPEPFAGLGAEPGSQALGFRREGDAPGAGPVEDVPPEVVRADGRRRSRVGPDRHPASGPAQARPVALLLPQEGVLGDARPRVDLTLTSSLCPVVPRDVPLHHDGEVVVRGAKLVLCAHRGGGGHHVDGRPNTGTPK